MKRCFVFVNLLLVVLEVAQPSFAFNNNDRISFRDSWSVITLGDLHMEDDMTFHEQARQDCLHALHDYPLLGKDATPSEPTTRSSSSSSA